ncbi:uncharacterized protein BJ171DRAFT_477014 [Polychytrium aggregatum]|uniref:uncharacterized protein n=1 Tax=Polychytrium aggregatum TaxID=110093 RepID=UPI0022FF27A5|nr:uncharacterized protein BJ171DRAFT_477014 [Polychytrium aggregatum]KAI9202135.1 hypothetical protein BJ171DRAFT_477014 [Polychytrium aggregatum]
MSEGSEEAVLAHRWPVGEGLPKQAVDEKKEDRMEARRGGSPGQPELATAMAVGNAQRRAAGILLRRPGDNGKQLQEDALDALAWCVGMQAMHSKVDSGAASPQNGSKAATAKGRRSRTTTDASAWQIPRHLFGSGREQHQSRNETSPSMMPGMAETQRPGLDRALVVRSRRTTSPDGPDRVGPDLTRAFQEGRDSILRTCEGGLCGAASRINYKSSPDHLRISLTVAGPSLDHRPCVHRGQPEGVRRPSPSDGSWPRQAPIAAAARTVEPIAPLGKSAPDPPRWRWPLSASGPTELELADAARMRM